MTTRNVWTVCKRSHHARGRWRSSRQACSGSEVPMRKLVVGFVIASVGLAVPGTWVDAAQGLKGGPSKQVRGGKVTYTVTTSCRRVYLRSNPGGSRTALVPATRLVSGGSVTISRNVRSKAAFKKFSVVAY